MLFCATKELLVKILIKSTKKEQVRSVNLDSAHLNRGQKIKSKIIKNAGPYSKK